MIAAKDDAIAKLNQELMWYKRKMFGRSSEKLHQDDPNQLLIEFEGEKLMPLTDSQLEEEAQRVEETNDEIYRERQEKAVPILRFIKLLLEKYQTIDTPASALVNACKYALDRWDGLCRYCAIQVLRIYFAETSLRHEEGRLPGTAYISSGRSHRQEIILIGQEQRRRHLLFEGDAAIFVWGRQMKCGMVTFLPTPNKMPCGLEFITQPQGKYYISKRVKYMRNVLISLLIIPITFSFPINQESNKA